MTFTFVQDTVTEKGGPSFSLPKSQETGRLVERKVCFISDASTWQGEGRHVSEGRLPPNLRAFIQGRGLHAETTPSSLTVIFRVVSLRLVLGIVAASAVGGVWSPGS